MAAKGGRIDFMFLSPPYPAAGSATALADQSRHLVLVHGFNYSAAGFLCCLRLKMTHTKCFILFGCLFKGPFTPSVIVSENSTTSIIAELS